MLRIVGLFQSSPRSPPPRAPSTNATRPLAHPTILPHRVEAVA